MPRLTGALPKSRMHSSANARVTFNGRDYLLGPYGTKVSKQIVSSSLAETIASEQALKCAFERFVFDVLEPCLQRVQQLAVPSAGQERPHVVSEVVSVHRAT